MSDTSLNAFYYTLKTDAYDHSVWNDITVSKAVQAVPGSLEEQPLFLSINDTMVEKSVYYEKGLELGETQAQEIKTAQAYDNSGVISQMCNIKKSSDVALLKQDYQIYNVLAKQYPRVQEYAQYRDGILNIIRQ